jgi:uncharacterized RDD family membrane protein YckC
MSKNQAQFKSENSTLFALRFIATTIDYAILMLLFYFIEILCGPTSMIYFVISNVVTIAYILGMHINKQATVGKIALKLKLVDDVTLNKPTEKQYIYRLCIFLIPLMLGQFIFTIFSSWSTLVFLIILLTAYATLCCMAFFDPKVQALHDRLSGIRVIKY